MIVIDILADAAQIVRIGSKKSASDKAVARLDVPVITTAQSWLYAPESSCKPRIVGRLVFVKAQVVVDAVEQAARTRVLDAIMLRKDSRKLLGEGKSIRFCGLVTVLAGQKPFLFIVLGQF